MFCASLGSYTSCLWCCLGHPQPPDRSQHGCTVGVNRDPPVWLSTQAGWWRSQSASPTYDGRRATISRRWGIWTYPLTTGLAKNVNRQCIFLRARDKLIPPSKLCSPVQENRDEQRSHSALVDGRMFLTSSSHTSLCQDSNGSYCAKTLLLIERHARRKVIAMSKGSNFKSRDIEPSDPGPLKISNLALSLRFCEEHQHRRTSC